MAKASAAKTSTAPRRIVTCPPAWPKPNHWKPSGKSFTNSPSRRQRNASRHVTIVASVTTMLGSPSPAMSAPLQAPSTAPPAMAPSATTGIGNPAFASNPAKMLHSANCDPMEMSICRAMMTSAMPHAAMSTGAAVVSVVRSCCFPKNAGAKNASTSSSTPSAAATESSRKWRFIVRPPLGPAPPPSRHVRHSCPAAS